MRKIVFARTRHFYHSYQDFWRLVELSEFPTCHVDEMRLDEECVYIFTPVNGEFRPCIEKERARVGEKSRRAKIVWWFLERPDTGNPDGVVDVPRRATEANDEMAPWVDAIWVSDRYLASLDTRSVYTPLYSHPKLPETQRDPGGYAYDLSHLSSPTPRREVILGALGREFRIARNAWGLDRDGLLWTSRAMLNVHQGHSTIGEPLRFAVAAAYRMPLLSENLYDPWPLEDGKTVLQAPYAGIVGAVMGWMRSRGDLAAFGEALYQKLCVENDFRRGVEEAVRTTQQIGAGGGIEGRGKEAP